MRYLLINAYSARNIGDAAIVLATADLLRANGASEVRSASRYYAQDREFYRRHDIAAVPPLIPFAPRAAPGGGRRRVLVFGAGLVAAWFVVLLSMASERWAMRAARVLRLTGMRELLAADRVVVCGGGYLYSGRARLNLTLIHVAMSVRLSSAANRRPVMMPQSVGPLTKTLDRAVVRLGFKGVTPIVVRDEEACAEAPRVFRGRTDIVLCPDIAFGRWAREAERQPAISRPAVGIVVMDWTWAKEVDPVAALDRYVDEVVKLARLLADAGVSVSLYGHSRIPELAQDDVSVAVLVAERAGDLRIVVDPAGTTADPQGLSTIFANLDVLIGTRLHSCIIAMAAGTPSIGLAYQPKTYGTFGLLGLSEYCVDVETFDATSVAELAFRLLETGGGQRAHVLEQAVRLRDEIEHFYSRQLGPPY